MIRVDDILNEIRADAERKSETYKGEGYSFERGRVDAVDEIRAALAADALFDDLPPDLLRVLRDPTITIPRDHEVRLADGRTLFEHLEEWRNAPSDTASADLDGDAV